MNPRIVLSLVGLAVIVAAFVLLIRYPQYEDEAFYLLLGWMVVNFALLFAFRSRAAGVAPNAPSATSPFPSEHLTGAALPSAGTPTANPIGFCIYCAAPVAPGTRACPACGHVLPQW